VAPWTGSPLEVGARACRQDGQDGSSPLTTIFGVAIFLGFLLLSTQVLVHLYATSTVGAVAFDTARRAAADGASCSSIGAHERVVSALGDYGQRIEPPVCASDGEQTVVTIVGPTPANLVGAFGGALGMDRIERTARVRTEDFDVTAEDGE
jgi:hypothetical protein